MKNNMDLLLKDVAVDDLIPYAMNSRTHSEHQINLIASSIKEFGFCNPVLVDESNGIIAGHGRVMAAKKLGLQTVPVVVLEGLSKSQKKAYIIADNKLALNAGWDFDLLKLEIESLIDDKFDIDVLGFDDNFIDSIISEELKDDFCDSRSEGKSAKSLSERFLIPPFSVFNSREAWWQDRKKQWINIGIKSECGRADNLAYSKSSQPPGVYAKKNEYERNMGKKLSWDEFLDIAKHDIAAMSGTSIFDPVVCEIVYRWFSPDGGLVLDPFSGGSVRGVVASCLNRQYIGHDLRQEQINENIIQCTDICKDNLYMPAYICGDSRNIDKTCSDVEADLIFSCPPYADLEVYSNDDRDLSTMPYHQFKEAYFEIIAKACAKLKNDRFACFVVGEVRDKHGNYYDFVGDTIDAFKAAGLHYYNEAILLNQVGSNAIRASGAFSKSRKLGKVHQNILVFVKGDAKKATLACGDVDVAFPENELNND